MGRDTRITEALNCSFTERVKRHPLLSYLIIQAFIILVLHTILNYNVYSAPDGTERLFALKILYGHQMPYHDFYCEYPPVVILSFVLPGLIFREPLSYSLAFAGQILLADIVIMLLIARISAKLNLKIWEILGAYSLFILALGPITPVRHDMIPAMLVIASVYAFIVGKNKTTWALLAVGIMTKVYPIILAPLLAILYIRYKPYSELINGINAMLVIVLIIAVPCLIIDADGFLYFLTYHADRGLQSESSYATALLAGQTLGLTSVKGIFNFGSWNLSSPLADTLAILSPGIIIGLLLVIYIIYTLSVRRIPGFQAMPENLDTEMILLLLRFSLLAILIFIIANKVFSPQYLIWVAPFMPLLITRRRYLSWSLFIIIAILTQYVYPYHYRAYELAETAPVAIEATRNLLLIVLAFLVALPGHTARTNVESKVQAGLEM